MTASTASYDSSTRPGPVGLIIEGWREAWSRRRLISYLIRADLKKKGADTLLGNLWWVIDPLLQMMVYVVLVTVIRASSTPDYPMFIFAAILPWKWFSTAVNDGVSSVTSQGPLIKQMKFPNIIMPIAAVFAGVFNFAFGLIPLALMLIFFYSHLITTWLILIPVVAVVQLLFSLAVCITVAAINVFFRDVGNIARHFLRLWFYLSPALYSSAQVATITDNQLLADLFALNPFATLFESYRNVIYSGTAPLWGQLLILSGVSLVLIAGATLLFKKVEPTFAKVL